MSNDKAVMQHALEFVEFCWRDVPMNAYAADKRDAIEAALRAAIAQPVQPDKDIKKWGLSLLAKAKDDAIDRAALAAFNEHFFKCTPSCTVKDWTNAWKKAIAFWTAQPVQPAAVGAVEQDDTKRLDLLDAQGYAYGFEDMHEGNRWLIEGPFKNVREAIDAAIAAKEVKL